MYPSLIGLEKRMTREQVIGKIRTGGGKMPPFAGMLQGKEDAIATFLLSGNNRKQFQQESDLLEIRQNRSAMAAVSPGKADTVATYLNVLAYAPFKGSGRYPAIQPPWGVLNAIDLNTGEYVWKIPVGNDSTFVKKGRLSGSAKSALSGGAADGQLTGLTGSPGPIATAGGLVFIAGGKDRKFCAFDKDSGKLLWETVLPRIGSSTPCTYMRGGKQYIALSVAGNEKAPAGTIMAFALP